MRPHAFAAILVLATSATAFANGTQEPAAWGSTQRALKTLNQRSQLKATLGAKNEHIVLGERSGKYERGEVVYSKTMHLGLSSVTGYLPQKVEWREKLVMGKNGLEVHRLVRTASVKDSVIKAYQADMDAQFARKPEVIFEPKVEIAHEDLSAEQVVRVTKVKTGFFGGGEKLNADTWGHVTAEQIDQAVEDWGKK